MAGVTSPRCGRISKHWLPMRRAGRLPRPTSFPERSRERLSSGPSRSVMAGGVFPFT
jgi:hypothetical protein